MSKTLLIVDDEKSFLESLKDGLLSYSEKLTVLTAGSGKEALEVLSSSRVDLVVTDLKMPVMDGFQLLAHMTKYYLTIPVLVMTAFATPEIEKKLQKLGTSQFLEKPLEFRVFVDRVFEELAAGSKGFLHGISLATFLQLVEMEAKTYTLCIKSTDKVGYLHIRDGQLVDAETENFRGLKAAYQIVVWDETEIEIENICRVKENKINISLTNLLLEACRQNDETERDEQIVSASDDDQTGFSPDAAEMLESKLEPIGEPESSKQVDDDQSESPEYPIETVKQKSEPIGVPENSKHIDSSIIDEHIKPLIEFDGLVGLNIRSSIGQKYLTYQVEKLDIEMDLVGSHALNVMIHAKHAAKRMQLGENHLIHIQTEHDSFGHILIRKIFEDNSDFHEIIILILLLNKTANLGLAKLRANAFANRIKNLL